MWIAVGRKLIGSDQWARLQHHFWIRFTYNFEIRSAVDFRLADSNLNYKFIPIHAGNCHRVAEFREESRINQYRAKLAHGEIGYFAEYEHKMSGSIWATLNERDTRAIVRTYMPLAPREALIHDIVTGEGFRGKGIGSFMTGQIADILLRDFGAQKIIIDVNIRNRPSLRMMERAGLRRRSQMVYVTALGTLAFSLRIREFKQL
jgi:RimJ/RimL family protein N-acetyltransferase